MSTIGRIGCHESHPERLALIRPDGAVSNWFAYDATLETLTVALAAHGYTVRADGTVQAVDG